ncbi:MAG: hypothetical protein HY261_09370 [Chloroflexi bacterium]|nr:hypothetical protein [Chloroflexota bacterium]
MASRRSRRRDKREAETTKRRVEAKHGSMAKGPGRFALSTDWIVVGIILGVFAIAGIIFATRHFIDSGGSSAPVFNQVFDVTVASANPEIRLIADESGLYRADTKDWKATSIKGKPVYAVVADQANPRVAYAGGEGFLQRSNDAGATWRVLATNLPANPSVRSLAIDPSNSANLWAFIQGSGLYRSMDGAAIWTKAADITDATISTIAVKANAGNTLFAFSTKRGLVRSDDGGQNFQAVIAQDFPATAVSDVLTYSDAPETIYAIAGRTIYRSPDAGAKWSVSNTGATTADLVSIAWDAASKRFFAADVSGNLYTSGDGKSWEFHQGASS